ncbi:MAG: DUF1993 domain-containing protein [Alphaproteobacteria bacterium]|nr:DUF1993 domain-containing protein [Alphaproteobacteria bacterium]
MPISMYSASVPVFQRQLGALGKILDKAIAHFAARKVADDVLLQTRLYPDMFPLVRQVQIAADFAKSTPARLAGTEFPTYENNEASLADLRARIDKTLAYVATFKPAQIDGSEAREITLPIGGNPMTFKGEVYLLHFAMPNFYFHCTTAYDILRQGGLEIGKRDFIGGM